MFLIGLCCSATSFASSLVDSVGVENLEGKQLILHKIEPKESYYSLGRKYGVNPAAIIDYNRNKALTIGLLVKIPTQRPFVGSSSTQNSPVVEAPAEEFTTYTVKPKETLYSISKKFNVSIDELKKWNNLRVSALAVGQNLKLKNNAMLANTVDNPVMAEATSPTVVPNTPKDSTEVEIITTNEDRRLPASRYGLREIKEKGVATWIEDESLDPSKMIALHQTAPIGTIIKITNPMTQKSTFAKVVGKFAENESTRGVVILLTKTAADLLGALDKRFQVNLVYGVSDEQ